MIGIRCSECEAPREWQKEFMELRLERDSAVLWLKEYKREFSDFETIDKYKSEYENLCKFANDLESERDKLRKQLEIAVYTLKLTAQDCWSVTSESTGVIQSGITHIAVISRKALKAIEALIE